MRFISALVFLTACIGRASAPATPNGMAREAAVYAALVDSIYTSAVPDTLLVADSTLPFHAPLGGVPRWREQFDSIPAELAPALERVSQARLPAFRKVVRFWVS